MFSLAKLALAGTVLLGCSPVPDDGGYGDVYEQAAEDDGKADRARCYGYRAPDSPGFGGRVALTFDDGPHPRHTPAILRVLEEHSAPAAFLMVGQNVEANRGLVSQIAANPAYTVGSHSYSHKDFAKLGLEDQIFEIDAATAALASAGVSPTFFRFPYGSADCGAQMLLRERGLRPLGWHVDSADWCFASGDLCTPDEFPFFRYVPKAMRGDMKEFLISQLVAADGGIVLFHDIHGHTAEQLGAILDELEKLGFELTSVDDLDVFPLANGAPGQQRQIAAIGDECETDADCDFGLPAFVGFCHGDGFCSARCEDVCPGSGTRCVAEPGDSAQRICRR